MVLEKYDEKIIEQKTYQEYTAIYSKKCNDQERFPNDGKNCRRFLQLVPHAMSWSACSRKTTRATLATAAGGG